MITSKVLLYYSSGGFGIMRKGRAFRDSTALKYSEILMTCMDINMQQMLLRFFAPDLAVHQTRGAARRQIPSSALLLGCYPSPTLLS